jgi:hypothetical protein
MKLSVSLLVPGILCLLVACSTPQAAVPGQTSGLSAPRKPLVLQTQTGQLRKYAVRQQQDQRLKVQRARVKAQNVLRSFSSEPPEPELRTTPLLPPETIPAPVAPVMPNPFPPIPEAQSPIPTEAVTAPLAPGQEPLTSAPSLSQPQPTQAFRYDDLMWHLRKTQTPRAWQITRGHPEQIVAVIDTGVDYFHPAFRGRALLGFDFASQDADPMDEAAHGTHVAGIIGGNDANIQGIAPNVKLLAIKIFSAQGFAQGDFALARAIRYAVENGASIINLSLGSPTLIDCGAYSDYIRALNSAIDEAYSQGVSIVTAAGNSALDQINGRCSVQQNMNQIPVIATSETDQLAAFSNSAGDSHPKAVSAPGVNIFSAVPMRLVCNEQRCEMPYDYMDGTSMASPVVAGELALIRSAMYEDYVRTLQRRNARLSTQPGQAGPQPQRILSFRDFFHEQAAIARAQLSLSVTPAHLSERLLFSYTNQPGRRIPQGLIYEARRDPVLGFGRVDIGSAVEAASRVFTAAGL